MKRRSWLKSESFCSESSKQGRTNPDGRNRKFPPARLLHPGAFLWLPNRDIYSALWHEEVSSNLPSCSLLFTGCNELLDRAPRPIVGAIGSHRANRVVIGCTRLKVVDPHAENCRWVVRG